MAKMDAKKKVACGGLQVILILVTSGTLTLLFGTACETNPASSQPPEGMVNHNIVVGYGTQSPQSSDFHEWGIQGDGLQLAKSKYTDIALNLVIVPTLVPPPITTLLPCDSFYVDEEAQLNNCGSREANRLYGERFRAAALGGTQDTFELLLLYVSPGALASDPTAVGFSTWGSYIYHASPGTYGARTAFVFKNKLEWLLSAAGVNADSLDYYKKTMFGITSAHELGHELGREGALYDRGEEDSSNVHHHVYGYKGKCIMIEHLPWRLLATPESLFFCRDSIYQYQVVPNLIMDTCRDSLHYYIGIVDY